MNRKKISLICMIILISNVYGDTPERTNTDCTNGSKILTDMFYCRSIFGEPNCTNDQCRADYLKYKECSSSGCFGDMSNLSSISQYNYCLEKCIPATETVKAHAKGMLNCMSISSISLKLINYSILFFSVLFLIF